MSWRSLFQPATEKEDPMRFGRRDDDGRASEVVPASRSAVEVAPQPVIPSKRLQRVAEHFHTQAELLATMRQEFESEMEPLHELLVHQAQTMQRMLANLEERLRPLNEYADGEEANLDALEHRMNESGSDHVARSFAEYLADQRARIAGTRQQIDQQRLPFLQYGEEQRDTVEVALSRFDADMEALEQNLAEQRKVMLRMLDSMRSETFTAVKEFLMSRQEALNALASSGSTDPSEIGRSVQQLRRALEPMADSPQVRPVLERVDQADRRLVSAAPASTRPRMVPPVDTPPLRDLSPDDNDGDEATA
ncbi:MAG: hypothetical protein AB7G21_12590 [Dehalococcoidia bacterium]